MGLECVPANTPQQRRLTQTLKPAPQRIIPEFFLALFLSFFLFLSPGLWCRGFTPRSSSLSLSRSLSLSLALSLSLRTYMGKHMLIHTCIHTYAYFYQHAKRPVKPKPKPSTPKPPLHNSRGTCSSFQLVGSYPT